MKRLTTGLAAALVVGSAVVPAEAEAPYCKDRNCVGEYPVKRSEEPHTHQEAAEQEVTDMVVIPMSPIITAPRNGPEHKAWVAEYGAQGERDIERFTKSYLSSN